jgi:hypothetical protein
MARAALLASACMMGAITLGVAQASAQAPRETVTEVDPIDIPPERDPLAHAFDRPGERGGFYLRASATIGYNSTRLGPASWEGEYDDVRARGFGTVFGLDIGGFAAPWLAIHLDSTAGMLWNGEIDRDDLAIASDADENARILAYGLAPAATFFFPHDFFIKTAFGVGLATVKRGGKSDTTNPGFYMDLGVGKDVYVDDHVSVGIQMQILYMTLDNDSRANEARIQQYMWGFSVGFDSI